MNNTSYEALIVGGGPAGLAAAMAMGRMGRRVLLCDDRQPRNAPSEHINNFPGHDGVHPEVWRKRVRQELQKYPTVQLQTCRVAHIQKHGQEFLIKLETELESKAQIQVKKVLLAYGVRDTMRPIENYRELWGKSVFHCPYCHGFSLMNEPLGLLGNGDTGYHMLNMLWGLSQDLVLFTEGPSTLSKEQQKALQNNQIQVIETPIKALQKTEQGLDVVLENGDILQRRALYAQPVLPFQKSATLGEELGCEVDEMGFYGVNDQGLTSVPGVFAAGDIAGMTRHSVPLSMASGTQAAAVMVSELLSEAFQGSVPV